MLAGLEVTPDVKIKSSVASLCIGTLIEAVYKVSVVSTILAIKWIKKVNLECFKLIPAKFQLRPYTLPNGVGFLLFCIRLLPIARLVSLL